MTLQAFLVGFLVFLNGTVIPLLIAIAFVFFLWNMARYFIIERTDDARKKASQSALYGIIAFVIIMSIWGIVNLLTSSLGFGGERDVCPDYLESQGGCYTPPPCPPGVIFGACSIRR